jgi:hypothetical protein
VTATDDVDAAQAVVLRRLGLTAPSADALFKHFLRYGPDCVLETAAVYLAVEGQVALAKRMNDVIELATRRPRDGEPRDITSYRARITTARSGSVAHKLLTTKVKVPGDVTKIALRLHSAGESVAIIAAKTGRSTRWVHTAIAAADEALPAAVA